MKCLAVTDPGENLRARLLWIMSAPPDDALSAARQVLDSTSSNQWRQLSESTVVFGHQSVGWNIVDGLEAVSARYAEFELPVLETSTSEIAAGQVSAGPGLFHFSVGRNKDPESKISDFCQAMASELGRSAELALLKFCYADFGYLLDPDVAFEAYVGAMDELRKSNPNTEFIHATCPLTVPRRSTAKDRAKDLVKRLIGRPVYPDPNVARHRYSTQIIEHYGPEVFDIAGIESTRPDGSPAGLRMAGQEVPFMVAEWTDDGGHLSSRGKERAAEEFVRALLSRLS